MPTPAPAKQAQALPQRLNLRPERNILRRQLPQLVSGAGGGASSVASSANLPRVRQKSPYVPKQSAGSFSAVRSKGRNWAGWVRAAIKATVCTLRGCTLRENGQDCEESQKASL